MDRNVPKLITLINLKKRFISVQTAWQSPCSYEVESTVSPLVTPPCTFFFEIGPSTSLSLGPKCGCNDNIMVMHIYWYLVICINRKLNKIVPENKIGKVVHASWTHPGNSLKRLIEQQIIIIICMHKLPLRIFI